MDDNADRFINAITDLRDIADSMTPEEAVESLDDITLQNFWREWRSVSGWAGSLWRLLNQDLGDAARPAAQGGTDVGGSG